MQSNKTGLSPFNITNRRKRTKAIHVMRQIKSDGRSGRKYSKQNKMALYKTEGKGTFARMLASLMGAK